MKKRPAVLHFIDKEREKGAGDQEIRHKLLDAGWSMDIIQNALGHKNHSSTKKKPAKKPVTKKSQYDISVKSRINYLMLLALAVLLLLLLALFL